MQQLGAVGLHIFYRWPGQRGLLAARENIGSEADYETLAARANSAHAQVNSHPRNASDPGYIAIADLPIDTLAPGSIKLALPAAPVTSAVFMTVDPAALSGSWAVTALAKCAGHRDCQVLAYQSAAAAERNRMVPATVRDRPVFLFLRDAVSGMDVALWDCDRVQRPTASQCLPSGGRAMADLMRERG
jgi:hypothetical protein